MFLSMTGFGRSKREFDWGTVFFEITSVNHKYQDIVTKLPPELSSIETQLINLIRNSLGRGHIRLAVEIDFNPEARLPLIDETSVLNFYNQIKRIGRRHNFSFSTDLNTLLQTPGFMEANISTSVKIANEVEPAVWNEILNEAIKNLNEMKKSEGAKLQNVIEKDLGLLEKIVISLDSRWQLAKNEAVENLRTRIQNVMEHFNLELDEARIAQEVTLISDKWDVSEELARFHSHLDKFRTVINDKDSSGRKLDFLIQEIMREINTMGSKVNDAPFRWGVVEAKTCIERIREQIQNVE